MPCSCSVPPRAWSACDGGATVVECFTVWSSGGGPGGPGYSSSSVVFPQSWAQGVEVSVMRVQQWWCVSQSWLPGSVIRGQQWPASGLALLASLRLLPLQHNHSSLTPDAALYLVTPAAPSLPFPPSSPPFSACLPSSPPFCKVSTHLRHPMPPLVMQGSSTLPLLLTLPFPVLPFSDLPSPPLLLSHSTNSHSPLSPDASLDRAG